MLSGRFFLLAVALFVLFALAYQPQKRIELNLAAVSNQKFLTGFLATETEAVWTEAKSAIWLASLGGANLPWRICLRLSGAGRGRFDRAAHVIVTVNGTKLGEFNASNEERDYEWEIGPWASGLNGDFLLEIDSTTFPFDQRELGGQVDRFWLARAKGLALPSVRGLLFATGCVSVEGLLLRMSFALAVGPTRRMTWAQ